ncbi:MAG: dihydrofolate reductase, partial [Muribaculaceae bacterium]|nr:dihydrofolate reductase [Muribaculaceae bacterium]
MISLIVAIDRKGGIGRNGDLLFHISADLKRFKALTMGNTIVMGRRTFESLPKGALPGRQNVVITRSDSFSAPGADVVHSVEEALEVARKDVFIIGGAE